MPTPKSAELFERLVAARNRLNDITTQLKSIDDTESALNTDRHRILELRWNEAFYAFETAAKDFYEGVREIRSEIDSIRSE